MLGWGVTIGAGLASYPLDTIRYVIAFSEHGFAADVLYIVVV